MRPASRGPGVAPVTACQRELRATVFRRNAPPIHPSSVLETRLWMLWPWIRCNIVVKSPSLYLVTVRVNATCPISANAPNSFYVAAWREGVGCSAPVIDYPSGTAQVARFRACRALSRVPSR